MDNDYEILYMIHEDKDIIFNILLKKYKFLIDMKVNEYCPNKKFYDDFYSEAEFTLYNALDNYIDCNLFSTYLNKCLNNSLINYSIKCNRNKNKILNDAASLEDSLYEIKSNGGNPEKNLLEYENYVDLKKKICDILKWDEELVFTLKISGFSPKEISDITNNNLRNVYNIIKRIKNKVSKLMSN